MGLYIPDTNKAVAAVKELCAQFEHVRVQVRRRNPLIAVDFMEDTPYGPQPYAGFTLIEQVNCCGVLVSTKTFVAQKHQNQKIAQAMMPLKEAIAKQFGYSALAATVNMTGNPAEVHILRKCGWELKYEFRNARTGNQVGFFFKGV